MLKMALARCIKLLVCLLVNVNTFTIKHEGVYRLDIIHYNDFHARFEETSVSMSTCRSNNDQCLGGFPRLFWETEELLKEKPDALLLNAGDSFQGTYWYTLLKWKVIKEFMNLLPHDAHAIGNHEFDDGPEGLAPYLASLKAPVLAANMDSSNEPALQGLYRPHLVLERKGRKIGIIGLTTTETKELSSPGNVKFTDPKATVAREAALLTSQGVDIIVVLSHCGLDIDKEIAREHGEFIDIIVGGHTHSLLWNGKSPSDEEVAGPYPVFIEPTHDQRHEVLIVQASAFTKYMGNLSVYFDYKGDYVKWDGGPIFLNRSIPEEARIKERLAPYAQIVHEAQDQSIGETEADLNFEDCVYGECALGNLMVDAFTDQAFVSIHSEYDFVSIVQRGDIKSSILKGNVTVGEIFELLPYDDRLYTFELQGKYLREALERSVADAWDYDPFKGPWVLQVSNVEVTYNVSHPDGQRLISASVNDKPLDDDLIYQVTTPSYLADGGDGFTMLKNYRRNVQVIGRDQRVVTDYIKKNSPIKPELQGRITILS